MASAANFDSWSGFSLEAGRAFCQSFFSLEAAATWGLVSFTLFLQSKQSGAGTSYRYTLQTTSWDSTDFPNPSFAYPAISGNLAGGTNAQTQQQTLYSYGISSYVSGSQPTGYDAVGNLVGYTDAVICAWSMVGGYDTLNRLTAAKATAGAYSGLQVGWGYDAFGNRTSQSYSGTTGVSLPTASTTSYNAYNQISSSSLGTVRYDASGDVRQDNRNKYLYDGEGRVCAVQSLMFGTMTGYIYGADGTRVSTGTIATWGSCDPAANGYQATKDSILGPTGASSPRRTCRRTGGWPGRTPTSGRSEMRRSQTLTAATSPTYGAP